MKSRFYISFFFLLFISGISIAQKSTGDKHYDKLEYAEAIKHYKKDYEKNNNRESLMRLADCYYRTHNYAEALKYYQELEKTGLNAPQLFCMAQLYFENDQPEKGNEYLQQYAAVSGSKWWSDFVNGVNVMKEEMNNYLITNVKYLNTAYSEFSPQIVNAEILFTSDRPASLISSQTYGGTATPFLNIFITDNFSLNDSTYKVKTFFEKSDVSAHAGPAVFDAVNSVLYYTYVNDLEKGQVNKAGIFSVVKKEKKWDKPVEITSNHQTSFGHPILFGNDLLIISSDLVGGKGGKDLYYFNRNDVSGSIKPIPGVNTPGDEVFPSVRKMSDGKYKLYFSSDGFPGKGGLDFFSMDFDLQNTDTTITWHKELSSSHDDFGIVFEDESHGYFSSDRSGGKGGDDIYHFIENPNAVQICITCLKDGSSCNGKAVAIKKDNEILQTVYTDENGCVFIKKLPDGANAMQFMDNSDEEIKIKSFLLGPENKSRMVFLDRNGYSMLELINEDGKLVQSKERTVWLTDKMSGQPARGIKIEVRSINGEVFEAIITDEKGSAIVKKIPPGEKFILAVDADEVILDPFLKSKSDQNVVLVDLIDQRVDSLSTSVYDIKLTVLKIKTLDVCLYNQITGEPLAHYRLTVRAEDGTPIDTVITDGNGCYRFKKLPQGNMLLTIENYDGGAITTRINGMKESGLKSLVIKGNNGMIIESIDENGNVNSKTFCIYDKITGQPIKEILVHLADEKYKIIDSVVTGKDGCFTYRKLGDDFKNLTLILAADEAEFFVKSATNASTDKSDLMALNVNGNLLDSISSRQSDFSIGILQRLIISGCLTSKKDGQPLAYTKVYFKDDKGNKTDSVITDKNGCFEYKKLGGDISDLQVMYAGDFELAINKSKSTIPGKLKMTDKNNNTVQELDPNFKFTGGGIKTSLICFYDNLSGNPLAGMQTKINDGTNTETYLTSSQGCIQAELFPNLKYTVSISATAEKPVLVTPSSTSGFNLSVTAGNNTVSGTYSPGKEIIVNLQKTEYVTAVFVNADGNPVSGLPVEWYDSDSKSWTLIPTEANGNSKHIYDKTQGDYKVRVKDGDEAYNFSTANSTGNVNIVDNKGDILATTSLNEKKTFSVTVRPLGKDKGEINIAGIISSTGNPVSGATIYVKTEDGILIQRTSSDKNGNYYFKKLPSSSMLIEIDTADLRMKFKSRVELNGNVTSFANENKSAGTEIIMGDGTGLKLEIQKTDENGNFAFQVNLDKIYSGIKNSADNPWADLSEGELKEITLNSIYFDYDKWNITFESERELDKAVKFLKAFPTASFNIKAHTDARGSDDYNLLLSRKRAKSVMNYFTERGIDTMRLMSFGYGESQLINKCDNNSSCSDALHKKNRRIEFEISWNGTSHNSRMASPLITSNTSTDAINRVSTETNTTNTTNTTNLTNVTNTTNITNTTTPNETGRWYKIQISTSGKLISCTKENFKGVEGVEYYLDNGVYKYTVGKFATKEEAIAYRKNVIDLFPQAFPIILENGVRVK